MAMREPNSKPAPRATTTWIAAWTVAGAAALAGCADATTPASPAATECARVHVPHLALATDPACTVASHAATTGALPDLQFAAPLCFMTGFVPAEVIGADDRRLAIEIAAFSGIVSNPVAGTGLQSPPAPLFDAAGASHSYTAFLAASVVEVRTPEGAGLGALVTRDSGWAELDLQTTLPIYVAERLVLSGGVGDVFPGTVGDVILNGDEFSGAAANGSICGPDLFARLERAAATSATASAAAASTGLRARRGD